MLDEAVAIYFCLTEMVTLHHVLPACLALFCSVHTRVTYFIRILALYFVFHAIGYCGHTVFWGLFIFLAKLKNTFSKQLLVIDSALKH